MNIEQEMDNMAETMEKSMTAQEEQLTLIKSRILSLGSEGLKKAVKILPEDQKVLLKGILEDMKRISREESLEPAIESTPNGRQILNEKDMPQDYQDEVIAKEAIKKKQMEIKHQGGNVIEGWEGQEIEGGKGLGGVNPEQKQDKLPAILKAEEMSPKQKKHEKEEDKEIKKLKEVGDKLEDGQEEIEKAKEPKKLKKDLSLNPVGVASIASAFGVKKADSGSYGVDDGDMMMKKEPKEKDSKDMEKKKEAKENLKKMMKRMQERKLDKSECIAAISARLSIPEEVTELAWESIEKSEKYKYDDGLVGEATPEAKQVRVPELMEKGEEGKVIKKESPEVPAYKDKSAENPKKEAKPESGKSKELADEAMAEVPDLVNSRKDMKKSFFYEEELVYQDNKNPIMAKSIHYAVDEYIAAEDAETKATLSKSKFMEKKELKKDADELDLGDSKYDEECLKEHDEKCGPHEEEMDKCYGPDIEKAYIGFNKLKSKIAAHGGVSNPAAVAAAIGRKKYGKEAFEAAAHKHHKMGKMKKSLDLNDLIEKALDKDDVTIEAFRKAIQPVKLGAVLVKSFSDEEMESLFKVENNK